MLTATRNDLYRPSGSIGRASPWTKWGPARLGDTRPGAARRGLGPLTDLREAMSAFCLFMSAYRPAPDLTDTRGVRELLTHSGHFGEEVCVHQAGWEWGFDLSPKSTGRSFSPPVSKARVCGVAILARIERVEALAWAAMSANPSPALPFTSLRCSAT